MTAYNFSHTFPFQPNFLGILQDLADSSQCSSSQAKAATPTTPSVNHQERVSVSNSTPRVVGLSSAELESLNELIHIDHVYFKPQPETPEAREVLTSNIAHESNKDLITAQPEPVITITETSGGVKRDHHGNAVFSNISSDNVSSLTDNFNGDLKFTLDTDITDTTDDLISSLTDSEIDPSMEFLQNLALSDFLGPDTNVAGLPIQTTSTSDISPHFNQLGEIMSVKDISNHASGELDAHKLFDEIYDSYMNPRNTSSPDTTNVSDSGCDSDIGDSPSPQSSEASLLDECPWQDSFTDLFPDLQ